MTFQSFTEAKLQGYRVNLDLVDKVYRVYTPDGELIAKVKEAGMTSSQMWDVALLHMVNKKRKNDEKNGK